MKIYRTKHTRGDSHEYRYSLTLRSSTLHYSTNKQFVFTYTVI